MFCQVTASVLGSFISDFAIRKICLVESFFSMLNVSFLVIFLMEPIQNDLQGGIIQRCSWENLYCNRYDTPWPWKKELIAYGTPRPPGKLGSGFYSEYDFFELNTICFKLNVVFLKLNAILLKNECFSCLKLKVNFIFKTNAFFNACFKFRFFQQALVFNRPH